MNMKLKILVVTVIVMTLLMFIPKENKDVKNVTSEGNVWYGNQLNVDVKKGKGEYTFRSVYPNSSDFKHASYEMSSHMVTNNNVDYDIPQTLMMVDASKDYMWTPNGIYSYTDSNYEVLYCCDAETGYSDGVYYKRTNLEDADYYDKNAAAYIRAIVTNSYPYVSLEQMKANLAREGFVGAEKLNRAEIITAVQAAIWAYSNENVGQYKYGRSFSVPHNTQWGGSLHDFTNEMDVWWTEGKRKFSTNEEVANRINSLIKHLKNQTAVYADKNQLIISEINMDEFEPILNEDGTYTIDIKVRLNNSGSNRLDDIKLEIYVDDIVESSKKIELGVDEYKMTVKAKAGQAIKAVVSGTQIIPKGVYLYEPEGGRKVSQSLVGVAKGTTNVYAESDVLVIEKIDPSNPPLTPEIPTEEPEITEDPIESSKPSVDEDIEKVEPTKAPLVSLDEKEEVVEESKKDNKEENKTKADSVKKVKNDITPDTSDTNDDLGLYIVIMLMVVVAMIFIRDEVKK